MVWNEFKMRMRPIIKKYLTEAVRVDWLGTVLIGTEYQSHYENKFFLQKTGDES